MRSTCPFQLNVTLIKQSLWVNSTGIILGTFHWFSQKERDRRATADTMPETGDTPGTGPTGRFLVLSPPWLDELGKPAKSEWRLRSISEPPWCRSLSVYGKQGNLPSVSTVNNLVN